MPGVLIREAQSSERHKEEMSLTELNGDSLLPLPFSLWNKHGRQQMFRAGRDPRPYSDTAPTDMVPLAVVGKAPSTQP